MIDLVLLIARLLFVALLYLFLFAIMRTGIGMVKGSRKKERGWTVSVERGPKELRGVSIAVHGPVIVGRSPGADIVIGVSAPGVITPDMVASMADDAIVFAMANPTPEIFPDEARAAGARVVGTGRSDFPNQVNNVIAFPGIFKGALQARAERITEPMKLAAAEALAALVSDEELTEEFIMPDPFDSRVADAVAAKALYGAPVIVCARAPPPSGKGPSSCGSAREHGRLRHLRGGRRRRQIDADPLPRTASGRRRPRGGAPARARGHRRGRGFARRRA